MRQPSNARLPEVAASKGYCGAVNVQEVDGTDPRRVAHDQPGSFFKSPSAVIGKHSPRVADTLHVYPLA
jgi:hypothetical protein